MDRVHAKSAKIGHAKCAKRNCPILSIKNKPISSCPLSFFASLHELFFLLCLRKGCKIRVRCKASFVQFVAKLIFIIRLYSPGNTKDLSHNYRNKQSSNPRSLMHLRR